MDDLFTVNAQLKIRADFRIVRKCKAFGAENFKSS